MLYSSKTRSSNKGRFHRRTPLGFHSGIEDTIGIKLINDGETFEYEPGSLPYPRPEARYTPDFVLPNGIVVESKGYFTPEDRAKHLLLKKTYPDLDVRFVFTRNGGRKPITSRSKTTYGQWCLKNGFQWEEAYIPEEWLREPPNEASLKVLKEHLIRKGVRKRKKKDQSTDRPLLGNAD